MFLHIVKTSFFYKKLGLGQPPLPPRWDTITKKYNFFQGFPYLLWEYQLHRRTANMWGTLQFPLEKWMSKGRGCAPTCFTLLCHCVTLFIVSFRVTLVTVISMSSLITHYLQLSPIIHNSQSINQSISNFPWVALIMLCWFGEIYMLA